VAAGDDHRHAVELDGRLHHQAVEVDLALDGAAVLVGRVAERDVDGPEGFLGLRDVVGDAGRGVEADPDLADVVGVPHRLQDPAQPCGRRPALDPDRAAATDLDPDGSVQGAEVGRDALPDDDPLGRALDRRQGHLTAGQRRHLAGVAADPGQPRHRLTAGHRRPQVGAGRRPDPNLTRPSPQRGQRLGPSPDRDEVGGHRAVPPSVGAVRRVEHAPDAGPLRRRLGGGVIQGRAGGAQHDVGGCHRGRGRRRRLGAAPGQRRERDDHRLSRAGTRGPGELRRDLGIGQLVDHDGQPLARPQPEVVPDHPAGDLLEGGHAVRHRPLSTVPRSTRW
jgi:hypothetical protein